MLYFKHYDAEAGLYLQTLDGVGIGNITETEYNDILSVIRNRHTAPDGYGYRLREDLTWELYELPIVEEAETITAEQLADMSNAELKTLMADMGIGGTMNKDNMIALIMSRQNENG